MGKTAAQRQKDYRDKKRNAQRGENVTRVTVEPERNALPPELVEQCIDTDNLSASLEHYLTCPDQYATRTMPDKINWGPWMNSQQLERAGLKANRVPIPGDWDYEGEAVFIPGLPLSAALAATQEAIV